MVPDELCMHLGINFINYHHPIIADCILEIPIQYILSIILNSFLRMNLCRPFRTTSLHNVDLYIFIRISSGAHYEKYQNQ